MKVSLAGMVVVVTGAASGIGAAIARAAANSGVAGLLLTDRNATGLEAVARDIGGVQVATHCADLVDPGAPGAIARAAREAFGRIDALVNAAGLTTRASMLDGTPDIWDSLFAVNARAPYFLMQQAIADMKRRGAAGSIVNILSMNAHCGSPELAIYSATKGALATLTKNAANAHMADRIRVNGIMLGWTDTEGERAMQAETLGKGEGWQEEAAKDQPLGRLLSAEETARLALFQLSDASAPMSGVLTDFEQRVVGRP